MLKRTGMAVALAAIFFCAHARAAGLEATVVSVEGEERSATLAEGDAGLAFEGAPVVLKDIAEIKFAARSGIPAGTAVYLRNGDVLRNVKIVSGDDSKLSMKTETLGDLALENKFIHAFTFAAKDKPAQEGIDVFLAAPKQKEDQLLTLKGETISGYLEKFSDKDFSFNAGGQSRAYAFEQTVALRLAPLEDFKPASGAVATVFLRDESRISGKILGMKGTALNVEGINAQKWPVNTAALSSISFSGGKMVYLSDLAPAGVDEKPFVGGSPLVFQWRKDHSAMGGKLTLGGHDYERGIGVHSYSKLSYNLEGQYAKFLCDVGLDVQAGAAGNAAWKILIDGKEAAAGEAKFGQKATAVKLELKGAARLELICDYGTDEDDASDLLDWAAARLIKP